MGLRILVLAIIILTIPCPLSLVRSPTLTVLSTRDQGPGTKDQCLWTELHCRQRVHNPPADPVVRICRMARSAP